MDYVFPPPPPVSVPTADGRAFPVRRVYCVGRNYAAHAREMGGTGREPPFFFAKPADALLTGGADMPYPPGTSDLHFEMELVVAIGAAGRSVPVERAASLVWGYAAGLDMTRRDLQGQAKKDGKPWDMGKAFDHSAPIGALIPAADTDPSRATITLAVNGVARQSASIADMIWSVPEIIAALSSLVALAPGDLVFTGTPDGVGAVVRGDLLDGVIEGVGTVRTKIA